MRVIDKSNRLRPCKLEYVENVWMWMLLAGLSISIEVLTSIAVQGLFCMGIILTT